MRDHSHHVVFSRDQIVSSLSRMATRCEKRTEIIPIAQALQCVTAHDICAKTNIPNVRCAAMDGIAVRYADFTEGMPDTSFWRLHEHYEWANTGVALPCGYDTAIAIECVSLSNPLQVSRKEADDPGVLTILAGPSHVGDNCREEASVYAQGETIIPVHTRITPTSMAALAMGGVSEVEVIAPPRIVFIPTGDELVAPDGRELPLGKAFESNGLLVQAKASLWGATCRVAPCISDDWNAIVNAVRTATHEADLVILNAGSSKGSKDFTMELLEEIGEVICHEANHGPGRHTSLSVVNSVGILGISGPPSGCEITTDWYVKPFVDTYLYGEPRDYVLIEALLGAPLVPVGNKQKQGIPGRAEPESDFFSIKPVRLVSEEGCLVAYPIAVGRHAKLDELDQADGYINISRARAGELEVGQRVSVELRYPFHRL